MGTGIRINQISRTMENATVSIFDRGFLYGDSVYEVLRTYDGVPFELERHLDRLADSARRIGMSVPMHSRELAFEVAEAHRESGNTDSYVRIVVTRGAGVIDLYPSETLEPWTLVLAMPLRRLPPEMYSQGAKVAIVPVVRNHPQAIDPLAKTGNYLNSVMALREARRVGAHEAILLDPHGRVTEGASSNVFGVVDTVLLTPSLEVGLLEGITRRVVIDVARELGYRVLEVPIGAENLRAADEVFITSSIREIVPVTQIDEQTVGTGQPGPVVTALRSQFADYVRRYVAAFAQ